MLVDASEGGGHRVKVAGTGPLPPLTSQASTSTPYTPWWYERQPVAHFFRGTILGTRGECCYK